MSTARSWELELCGGPSTLYSLCIEYINATAILSIIRNKYHSCAWQNTAVFPFTKKSPQNVFKRTYPLFPPNIILCSYTYKAVHHTNRVLYIYKYRLEQCAFIPMVGATH